MQNGIFAVQTSATAHQTTPSAYKPLTPHLDEDQHNLRVLIDEVATTRGLILQMATRLMAYHAAPDERSRDVVRDEFLGIARQFERHVTLVFGKGPVAGQPQSHVDMIRTAAAQDPQRNLQMQTVLLEVQRIAKGVAAGTPLRFDQARAFLEQNWPVVRDQMTQVISDVWANIDAGRKAEIETAKQAANALGTRLSRLEHIGRHVRLVSLNASVEAARAGDVGKGLLVIAQEFKSLAEEIQTLAKDARCDMALIS